jgi:hypothetical protein
VAVPVRLAVFDVGLLAAFGAAFGIGRTVGPVGDDQPAPGVTTTVPVDHGEHP